MFGISLSEFIVIAILIILLVKPSDIPGIIKQYRKLIKKMVGFKREVYASISEIHNKALDYEDDLSSTEQGFKQGKEKVSYVIDDEGKLQQAYDIEDLKENKKKK